MPTILEERNAQRRALAGKMFLEECLDFRVGAALLHAYRCLADVARVLREAGEEVTLHMENAEGTWRLSVEAARREARAFSNPRKDACIITGSNSTMEKMPTFSIPENGDIQPAGQSIADSLAVAVGMK